MYYSFQTGELAIRMIVVMILAVFLFCGLFGIAMYVLRSLSLYTIAKRRGLSSPWLAWIPVGREWLLGSVSDQYKYLVKGKHQSWRKVVLTLSAVAMVCALVTMGLFATMVGKIVVRSPYLYEEQIAAAIFPMLLEMMLMAVVTVVVEITAYVFRCLCRYDLYRSCDPKNAVVFLVIGILFSVTEPFFLFACREKDLGMPPRRPVQEQTQQAPYQESWQAQEDRNDQDESWKTPEEPWQESKDE